MNNNKKVILINGDNSKWYEQAIFIVKEEEKNIPKNIIFEAEKIINDYVNKKYNKNKQNNNIYLEAKKEIERKNINNTYSNNTKNLPKNINKKNNKKVKNYLNLIIFSTICIIFYLAYLIWF